jgi:hypothetical protein
MLKKKKVVKWYKPKVHSGWSKDLTPIGRRRKVYKAHKTYLSTAKSLQALANITKDKPTKTKATADAKYFYRMHKKTGK